MPRTSRTPALLLIALVATLTAALTPPATATEAAPVETTLVEAQGARATATGSLGLVGYTAAHEIRQEVAPGGRLGGLRLDRASRPEALAGAWGQGGELGAWLGPPSATPEAQFVPTSTLVESVYFEDQVGAEGAALLPGDRAELAMAVVPLDAPLPWDRARGATGGRAGWDRSTVHSSISAEFAGRAGRLDVVQFRADIVVRGGDLDARTGTVALEPLAIPLGRLYPDGVRFVGISGVSGPATTYVEGFSLAVAPAAGTAVLRASVTGYIPEARVRVMPNGAEVKEWHIPLTGVIAIEPEATGLVPQIATRLPQGGEVLAITADGQRRLDVDAGALISATPTAVGPATSSEAADEGATTEEPEISGAVSLTAASSDPMDAAAHVHAGLTEPVRLDVPAAGLTATVDPDHRGEGALAVRDVRSTWLGQSYARSATVPVVELDGAPVALDAGNLVDLRALPVSAGGGVRVGLLSSGEGTPPAVTTAMRLPGEGLLVDAVHDLGGGTYAFVTHQVFNGGVPAGGRLNTTVSVRSLTAPTVAARPRFHVELDTPGPAAQGTTPIDTEATVSSGTFVAVGEHRVDGVYRGDGFRRAGRATLLQAPAPLGGRAPDPSATLVDQPVAVVVTPPEAAVVEAPEHAATFRTGLSEPLRFGPALPPPLGSRCGPPQVVDLTAPEGAASGDITAAWFDDDPAMVYASIQLREVPTVATAPTGDLYAVHWRKGHSLYMARALLQPDGTWRFMLSDGSFSADTTGEVQPGPGGVVRIGVPREWLDLRNGTVLRDVAAHAFVGTTTARRDHAPKGSTTTFGLGPDHRIGGCAPLALDLQLDEVAPVVSGEIATVRARALDPAGQPVPGLLLDLALEDEPVIARTDPDGWAEAAVEVAALPGERSVSASSAGNGSYAAAAVGRPVEVLHRPSAMSARSEGNGINRELVATLTDALTGGGLAGRTVRFTADGLPVGVATTDDQGVARLRTDAVPRGGRAHAATFDGDELHAGATAATS